MKFSYDAEGHTSGFFALIALVSYIIPATYFHARYFLGLDDETIKTDMERLSVSHSKWKDVAQRKKHKPILKRHLVYVVCCVAFVAIAATKPDAPLIAVEDQVLSPFEILGVDAATPKKTIERAYRKLARTEHPDTSNHTDAQERWIKINEAKEILTNDEKRKNWEEFGDARGPQPVSWGLALPQWVVEESNHYYVLAVYFFFMVCVLPVMIGSYYFKNLKGDTSKVRMTTQWGLFREALSRELTHAQIIEVMCASLEFNDLVRQLPTDKEDLHGLAVLLVKEVFEDKMMKGATMEAKISKLCESPFKTKNNTKIKLLLMAHMFRVDVPSNCREDLRVILETFPRLIDGLLSMAFMKSQQTTQLGFVVLRTMEVSQMITQARRMATEVPTLQLPHVHLARDALTAKKLMLIQQLAQTEETERRDVLKALSDDQYKEVTTIMNATPMINISTEFESRGESSVTPGSMVSLRCKLTRYSTEKWAKMCADGSWGKENEGERHGNSTDESAGDVDEAAIDKMFEEMKRKKRVTKAKASVDATAPIAYAPYSPGIRREKWWLIVSLVPRDARVAPPILCAPKAITNLKGELEIDVNFAAPGVGKYNLAIQMKSADYAGFDARRVILFEVSPATQPITDHFASDDEDED